MITRPFRRINALAAILFALAPSVSAQTPPLTPDISGKVSRVLVREGQHVEAGAPLFEIDPQPFELAVRQAQSKLDTVVTDLANLKSNYQSLKQLVELGQQAVDIKQRDVERKTALAAKGTSTQVDLDNANAALLTAELQLQLGRQQLSSTFNQLLENADLRAEEFGAHLAAQCLLTLGEQLGRLLVRKVAAVLVHEEILLLDTHGEARFLDGHGSYRATLAGARVSFPRGSMAAPLGLALRDMWHAQQGQAMKRPA